MKLWNNFFNRAMSTITNNEKYRTDRGNLSNMGINEQNRRGKITVKNWLREYHMEINYNGHGQKTLGNLLNTGT